MPAVTPYNVRSTVDRNRPSSDTGLIFFFIGWPTCLRNCPVLCVCPLEQAAWICTVICYLRLSVFVCLWRSGNKTELFSDLSGFPVLQERRDQIQNVLNEIQAHRKDIRLTLKAPALDYTAVSGQEVPTVCVWGWEWQTGGRRLMAWFGWKTESQWWSDVCVCVVLLCVSVLIKSDAFFCLSAPILFIKVFLLLFLLCPQFLIEVKNSLSSTVPPDWVKIGRWAHSYSTHTDRLSF